MSNARLEDVFKSINVFTRMKYIFAFGVYLHRNYGLTFKVVLNKSSIVLDSTCRHPEDIVKNTTKQELGQGFKMFVPDSLISK